MGLVLAWSHTLLSEYRYFLRAKGWPKQDQPTPKMWSSYLGSIHHTYSNSDQLLKELKPNVSENMGKTWIYNKRGSGK